MILWRRSLCDQVDFVVAVVLFVYLLLHTHMAGLSKCLVARLLLLRMMLLLLGVASYKPNLSKSCVQGFFFCLCYTCATEQQSKGINRFQFFFFIIIIFTIKHIEGRCLEIRKKQKSKENKMLVFLSLPCLHGHHHFYMHKIQFDFVVGCLALPCIPLSMKFVCSCFVRKTTL